MLELSPSLDRPALAQSVKPEGQGGAGPGVLEEAGGGAVQEPATELSLCPLQVGLGCLVVLDTVEPDGQVCALGQLLGEGGNAEAFERPWLAGGRGAQEAEGAQALGDQVHGGQVELGIDWGINPLLAQGDKIGRASCRERV